LQWSAKKNPHPHLRINILPVRSAEKIRSYRPHFTRSIRRSACPQIRILPEALLFLNKDLCFGRFLWQWSSHRTQLTELIITGPS